MSNAGVNVTLVLWTFGTALEASKLPPSEKEGLSHFLRMLFTLTVVAE